MVVTQQIDKGCLKLTKFEYQIENISKGVSLQNNKKNDRHFWSMLGML